MHAGSVHHACDSKGVLKLLLPHSGLGSHDAHVKATLVMIAKQRSNDDSSKCHHGLHQHGCSSSTIYYYPCDCWLTHHHDNHRLHHYNHRHRHHCHDNHRHCRRAPLSASTLQPTLGPQTHSFNLCQRKAVRLPMFERMGQLRRQLRKGHIGEERERRTARVLSFTCPDGTTCRIRLERYVQK